MGIAESLKALQERINNSAVKAGRNSDSIKLIAVTKTVELQRIIEAIEAGISIFGENRVQEARDKIPNLKSQIPNLRIEWHLIGHLQKNKAKYSVQLFDLIHTIDSVPLAEEVNKQAKKINKKQRVLVQVKLSKEETKHGIPEEYLVKLLEEINRMENLKLEGLMTMPPFIEDPERVRPYFRRLRKIRDNINGLRVASCELRDLSMGMSSDFEVAIEEGATMVRIGTAIFGERNTDEKTK